MASAGTVVITMDADIAKVVEGIKKTNQKLSKFEKSVGSAQKKLNNIAKGVIGFYAVTKSIGIAEDALSSFIATSSQFETYENRMTAFTTSQAQASLEIKRASTFAQQFNLDIADTTETMLTLKNYGIDDSNESLKIFTNTAIGSGKSLSQYAEAVADALTGENERLKEFGVKASKIGEQVGYVWTDSAGKTRNVIIKNNKDIITSTLNAIMNEKYVGQIEKRSQSWAGLMQNMNNNWVMFQKEVGDNGLFEYFRQLGLGISKVMSESFHNGSLSAKQFADDTKSFIQSIITGIGYLAKAISGVANLMRTVYAGYQKLSGSIGMDMNTKRTENAKEELKELQRIQNDGDYGYFSNQNAHITSNNIKKLKKEISEYATEYKRYTDIRKAGDNLVETAAKSQANINKIIDGITAVSTQSATQITSNISDIAAQKEAAAKALDAIGAENGGLNGSSKKPKSKPKKKDNTQDKDLKGLKNKAKDTAKELENIFANIGYEFGNSMANAMGPVGSEVFKFYKTVSALSAAQSAQSQAENAAELPGNTIGAITKAGAEGGYVGSIAMAALLAAFGIAAGGALNTTVSQAEIDEAKGTDSFDKQGLTDSTELLKEFIQPQLTVSNKMLEHLESMDDKFGSIAVALTNSAGFDYDGSRFEETADSNWWGGKSTELLGAGLSFQAQSVGELIDGLVDVQGFQAILQTKSSFFGLVSKEKIIEKLTDVPSDIKNDLAEAFSDGFTSILEATTLLGFDTTAIEARLRQSTIDLGKLNFDDLDGEEKQKLLNDAFSAEMSRISKAAVNSVGGSGMAQALNDMQRTGEEYITTLTRVAVGFETVRTQLDLFGQAVTTFTQSQALIDAAGGLEQFNGAMSIFVENFFSPEEQQEMNKIALETALIQHGVALPASKEAFRALVLETQGKIIAVQAQIDARKAEIRAEIESGTYAVNNAKARAEVEKFVQGNMLLTGEAAVIAGRNFKIGFDNMTQAAQEAVSFNPETGAINIDFSAIGDAQLNALEATKTELSGLYGTLTSNMGAFADYYGVLEDAATKAQQALTDLAKSILDIQVSSEKSLLEFNNKGFESLSGKLQEAVNNVDYKTAGEEFNKLLGVIKNDETTSYKQKVFRIADANNSIQQIVDTDPNAELIKEVRRLREENSEINSRLRTQEQILRDIADNTENSSKVVGL